MSPCGDKADGNGNWRQQKRNKATFHGPVMIYQRPKAKQRMGRDFLMWGKEVGEYIRQRESQTTCSFINELNPHCVPSTVHKADVSPVFARHSSNHMMYTTEPVQ